MFDREEFLYEEVASFELTSRKSDYANIADVTITTKSGKVSKASYFLFLDMKNVVKLLYIQGKIENLEVDKDKSNHRFRTIYTKLEEMLEKEGCESL